MDRNELGMKIYNSSHITGEFLLRSGQISNEYFDKYKFESDPVLLKAIAEELAKLGWNVEVIWECETIDQEALERKLHSIIEINLK